MYNTKKYPRKYSISKCGKLSGFYLFKDNKITTDNDETTSSRKDQLGFEKVKQKQPNKKIMRTAH
jgi:hypothetical protein